MFDTLSWLVVVPLLIGLGLWSFFHSEDRKVLVARWIGSALMILAILGLTHLKTPLKGLFILCPSIILGTIWIRTVMGMVIRPLTGAIDGGIDEVEVKPFYFLAEGKRRQGQFREAIEEIEKQLQRFPTDTPGFMLRATIEAEDLHNLPAAKATLERLLALPQLPPQAAAAALQALADWQLQNGPDVYGARSSLERLVRLFPDTPIAHAAEQRLAHLEGVVAAQRARDEVKYTVKPRLAGVPAPPPTDEPDPQTAAAELVKQLERFPNDTETREKLAMLYAEKFQRLDLAIAQLEQLVSLPNEAPKHLAHWLNLMATLHIRYGQDMAGAEKALHRIIERFPKSAMANVALQRLSTLAGEMKGQNKTTAKTLGTYEKDLGLKQSPITG